MRSLEVELKDTKYNLFIWIETSDAVYYNSREKLNMYETVWHAPNDLMNCLKCGAPLPFGQHVSEHNERFANLIT